MTIRSRIVLPFALVALTTSSALAQPGGPPPPQALPPPPVPALNPITAEKAVLGKILFWDEQLSSDTTIACGTCHVPSSGGGEARLGAQPAHPGPDALFGTPDDIFGSPGVRRTNAFGHYADDPTFHFRVQATGRNAQSMIAAAYGIDLFWDGRADSTFVDPETGVVVLPDRGGLESQSLGPIMSDVEMASEGRGWQSVYDRLVAVEPLALATNVPPDMALAVATDTTYPALFQRAFGTPEINAVRIAFALATYQRTLIPDQSKFDLVARGQAVFTQAEQQGWAAFNAPGPRCSVCHSGPAQSDQQFHNLGIRPIAEDAGRSTVTGLPQDRGRFKTPSLRNVALRERYFHNGLVGALPNVLGFYDGDGGPFADNKDPLLVGLMVPLQVRPSIEALLNALTDPRVANETFPFDRPTLRSEQAAPNPQLLGFGAVAGQGGFVPQLIADVAPLEGNDGFRIGVHRALGGQFSLLKVQLDVATIPGAATVMDLRNGLPSAQMLSGVGPGQGHATWLDVDATASVLVGLTYDAQWWIRDFAAPGGIAKTNWARVTIEPR
jgi:cytochrome c peroxidase